MESIEDLIKLLTLEELDPCLYRGQSFMTPWGRVFGGQVLGQAMYAAYQTVPEDRLAHSMHAYFVLGGDCNFPIIYNVDTIRDGGSYTTRRVMAKQKGKTIFVMSVSFQKKEKGFDHQITAPKVLPPEELATDIEQLKYLEAIDPLLYRRMKGIHPRAIEFRPVEKPDPLNPNPAPPFRNIWLKAKEKLEASIPLQHQLLAYASDYNLLLTAVNPHQAKSNRGNLFLASLDHAMWFHRDFNMSDWLLYALDSPSASNGRGFSRGNIFDREGKLVASVVQEGVIREGK